MAKLPKLGQDIECTLEGYTDVKGVVWVNAPQRIFDEWQKLREDAIERDERGRPATLLDDAGEPVLDDSFEPLHKVSREKTLLASQYFISHMLLEFSVDEDQEGRPLSPQDADFMERVPEDLIAWVYNAVLGAVEARREAGKESVKLAGITGR